MSDSSVMEEVEKKVPEIKTGYVIRFSLVNLKMPQSISLVIEDFSLSGGFSNPGP